MTMIRMATGAVTDRTTGAVFVRCFLYLGWRRRSLRFAPSVQQIAHTFALYRLKRKRKSSFVLPFCSNRAKMREVSSEKDDWAEMFHERDNKPPR